MADMLDTLVEAAKTAFGPRLLSVVLYGSKASGEDTEKHSDYNVFIILDTVGFDDMKALLPVMAPWTKQGNRPPLLFSKTYFENSADVFPIEFLDMMDKHRVVYGQDPLQNLKIELTHLCHQCEFELKGKLLKLRQGYMLALGKPEQVRELLIVSVSSILVLFRHVLRLFDQVPPAKNLDALDMIARAAGVNTAVFSEVMAMKKGDKSALRKDPEALMREYLAEIEKVTNTVDNLNA